MSGCVTRNGVTFWANSYAQVWSFNTYSSALLPKQPQGSRRVPYTRVEHKNRGTSGFPVQRRETGSAGETRCLRSPRGDLAPVPAARWTRGSCSPISAAHARRARGAAALGTGSRVGWTRSPTLILPFETTHPICRQLDGLPVIPAPGSPPCDREARGTVGSRL